LGGSWGHDVTSVQSTVQVGVIVDVDKRLSGSSTYEPVHASIVLLPRQWHVPNQSWTVSSHHASRTRVTPNHPASRSRCEVFRMPIWFRKCVLARPILSALVFANVRRRVTKDDPHRSAHRNAFVFCAPSHSLFSRSHQSSARL